MYLHDTEDFKESTDPSSLIKLTIHKNLQTITYKTHNSHLIDY